MAEDQSESGSTKQTFKLSFANRNFGLLFGGNCISAFGDQFTLVALPWLVLKLTGSPAALGIVLAVMAFPCAIFMLIGGALVDQLSPKLVLLRARAANMICIAILAMLVLTGVTQMWMIYLLALSIGFSTAFAYPASSAILPDLVEPQQLREANAWLLSMRQLCMVAGPLLAGTLIALGTHEVSTNHLPDAQGMSLAFSVDAVSYLVSLVSLWMIRIHNDSDLLKVRMGVLGSVMGGIRSVWADLPLRALVLYVAFVSVFVGGPILVGLPVLADTRLNWGAASLGILMTANGLGMIVGTLLSDFGARLMRGQLGIMVLSFDCLNGLALASLGRIHTTTSAALLLADIGIFGGIVQIATLTWIQQRVSREMMGRTMSILLFIYMGLAPISAVIAGAFLKVISVTVLFGAAGLVLTATALACFSSRLLRGIIDLNDEN